MIRVSLPLVLVLLLSACGGGESEEIPTLEFDNLPLTIWTSHPQTEEVPPDFCDRARDALTALPEAGHFYCQERDGKDAAFFAMVETRGVRIQLSQGTEHPWVLMGFELEENARTSMPPEHFEALEQDIVSFLDR